MQKCFFKKDWRERVAHQMKNRDAFSKFRLSLLGRFELAAREGGVRLPSKKLSGLLAYLACTAPQRQPREKLAHLLWGSHFETQARQNLRQAIFRLRRILGQDVLLSDDDEIWLPAHTIDCDAVRFRALIAEGSPASIAAAADLYRGPFLIDLNIEEDAWSEWLISERGRLESIALDALIRQSAQAMQEGHEEAALQAARRAIEINALREDGHRLILQALVALGRQAEALKHYRDLVTLLKRELSAAPDAVTQSLIVELRGSAPEGLGTDVLPALSESSRPEPEVHIGEDDADPMHVHSPVPEQRRLTVLVCDLASPTSLSAALDPEDAHALIATFHEIVTDVAERLGGFAAQHQGNGIVAYFGYPIANEHDAERAVRAALAILDAIAAPADSGAVPIHASMGIATGFVVVGGKAMTRGNLPRLITGKAPSIAAQLQSSVTAGEIAIDATTQRLIGRMFVCRPLPTRDERPPLPPIAAWQVLGEAPGVSRFDARRHILSSLVGRQDELTLLLSRWEQSERGKGQVVWILGEPGIGKSRIAESLWEKLANEAPAGLRYACLPDRTQSPLHPFIAQLQQDAGFAPGDSASLKLDKLETLLWPSAINLPRDVALFAELLDVPLDHRYSALTASPQQKREMIFNALLGWLKGAASRKSTFILFEDAHWIDPTSLELLERIVSVAADLPVLLLVTCRPTLQPEWLDQPHVAILALGRLSTSDGAHIMRSVARERTFPKAVADEILSRSDGIPLFIEELTRSAMESGLLRETADGYVFDGPLLPRDIPSTLQAALTARLDLLGPAKNVATIGAAIGREFSHELIAAVTALPPVELKMRLAQLIGAGLLVRRGKASAQSYTFKHVLLQEAAYMMMLKSQRRQLHADIARTLVTRFPSSMSQQPEIIARHFVEAGLADEAIDHWIEAGRLAQARWANREASDFFQYAIDAVAGLSETQERLEQAIDLRFELKAVLVPIGKFERVVSSLREAEGLAKRLGDRHRLARFAFHMCQTLALGGDPAEASTFGQQALALAESLHDVPLQIASTLFLGTASFLTLEYRQVEPLFERVLKLLEDVPILEKFGLTGFPAVTVRAFLTRIYADQGKFEQGVILGEEGVRIAHAVGDPYSLTIACWCLADLYVIRGEFASAIEKLEYALALSRQFDLPFMIAGSSGTLGYVHAMMGRTAQGVPLLEQALSAFEAMGHRFGQALFLSPLGEAYLLAGRYGDAFEQAQRALVMAQDSGQRRGEAGARHLLAEISVRSGAMEQAEANYLHALAITTELGLRPLVARSHYGLAHLYSRIGQPEKARDQFEIAAKMYREMDMRFWLEQADPMVSQ